MKKILDISKILTVEDIENTDFDSYKDESDNQWIRYINSGDIKNELRVSFEDLNRIVKLSNESSKILLAWSMGDLYDITPKRKRKRKIQDSPTEYELWCEKYFKNKLQKNK